MGYICIDCLMRHSESTDRLSGGFHFEMLLIMLLLSMFLRSKTCYRLYRESSTLDPRGFPCVVSRLALGKGQNSFPLISERESKKTMISRISNLAILIMLVIAPYTYECSKYAVTMNFQSKKK